MVNPQKHMYSMENLEGTYKDLATWFTSVLRDGEKNEVTESDIVQFLNEKNRVPLGIVRKINNSRPKCQARTKKEFKQCTYRCINDSVYCTGHTKKAPTFTMDQSVEELRKLHTKKAKIVKEKVVKEKGDKVVITKKKAAKKEKYVSKFNRDLDINQRLTDYIQKYDDDEVGIIESIIDDKLDIEDEIQKVIDAIGDSKHNTELYKLIKAIEKAKKQEDPVDSDSEAEAEAEDIKENPVAEVLGGIDE